RAARARRLARETSVDVSAEPAAPVPGSEPDLAQVLDAELARLPDKFRLPIVLCELRELTTAQAAAELGWPVGTVASRRSRGRALLAARLRRRGLASGIAPLACAICRSVSTPGQLVTNAVSAAVGGAVPPAVAPALFNEVLRAMSMSKIRLACAGLIACV